MIDKWTKLAHGLVVTRSLQPDFVMLMDADDLVSCRLAAFANANKTSNGWIFRKGYFWRQGARWMQYTDQFNCGTNAIVSSRLIKFPMDVVPASIQECVILKNGHMTIEQALREQGTPLEPLPFPGAVWFFGHGDNWSFQAEGGFRRWYGLRHWLGSLRLRSLRRWRFLYPSLKREFGLLERL
jgi:hypothetical protein